MKLPKELTSVTPLSKMVAVIVFTAIMIIGFGLGINYQETIELLKKQNNSSPTTINKPTTLTSDETKNWKAYTNTKWKYKVSYPPLWNLRELDSVQTNLASQEATQEGSSRFFIDITVWNRNSRDFPTLKEEARVRGQEIGPCTDLPNNGAPGGACPLLQPKTISKKSFSDGNEYYLVITATDKQIAIIPVPNNSNQLIEIKSVIWPTDSKELFDQILATFKFTN